MCHFEDLWSCFYYLYRILHVSLVLNRPLRYNLFYTEILYAVEKKKNQPEQRTEGNNVLFILTTKRKKGEKNNQVLPNTIALC